jgi:hypothetical protein
VKPQPAERWQQVKDRLLPRWRKRQRNVGEDFSLRSEVEALLAAHHEVGEFLGVTTSSEQAAGYSDHVRDRSRSGRPGDDASQWRFSIGGDLCFRAYVDVTN